MHSCVQECSVRWYELPVRRAKVRDDRNMKTTAPLEVKSGNAKSGNAKPGDAKPGDAWVPTVCLGCYNCCGIKVHRVAGKVVDVCGDEHATNSKGHICAKGKARFLDLYHPQRVMRPLRRRNPEKGIGIDPQWEEISWPEALQVVTDRLAAVRREDPRGLIIAHFDLPGYGISKAFGTAFGTTNFHWNRADYCGAAPHVANLLLNGSFNAELDLSLIHI